MAKVSVKHYKIQKAGSTVTIAVGIAAFVVIFSILGSYALFQQRNFQARVINEKEKTVKQLEANKEAVGNLKESYQAFVSQNPNVLEGNKDGDGDNDGDNAKLILDALPSNYDFPALVSSMEKILTDNGYPIAEIAGIDAEAEITDDAKAEIFEMPYELTTVSNFDEVFELIETFERSIRPIKPVNVTITATEEGLQLDYAATSYYLPKTGVKFGEKVVK